MRKARGKKQPTTPVYVECSSSSEEDEPLAASRTVRHKREEKLKGLQRLPKLCADYSSSESDGCDFKQVDSSPETDHRLSEEDEEIVISRREMNIKYTNIEDERYEKRKLSVT